MGGNTVKGGKKHEVVQQGDTHAAHNLHENYSSHNVLFAFLWFSSSNPSRYSCRVLSFVVLFPCIGVFIRYCCTNVEKDQRENNR